MIAAPRTELPRLGQLCGRLTPSARSATQKPKGGRGVEDRRPARGPPRAAAAAPDRDRARAWNAVALGRQWQATASARPGRRGREAWCLPAGHRTYRGARWNLPQERQERHPGRRGPWEFAFAQVLGDRYSCAQLCGQRHVYGPDLHRLVRRGIAYAGRAANARRSVAHPTGRDSAAVSAGGAHRPDSLRSDPPSGRKQSRGDHPAVADLWFAPLLRNDDQRQALLDQAEAAGETSSHGTEVGLDRAALNAAYQLARERLTAGSGSPPDQTGHQAVSAGDWGRAKMRAGTSARRGGE